MYMCRLADYVTTNQGNRYHMYVNNSLDCMNHQHTLLCSEVQIFQMFTFEGLHPVHYALIQIKMYIL